MYQVLLLYENQEDIAMVRDYVMLGGFRMEVFGMKDICAWREFIYNTDIVLLYGEKMEESCEVCRQVRFFTPVPIIILSENGEEWNKIRMFRSGADDYLAEPIQQGELLARMKVRIERFRRLTKPLGYLNLDGLTIDALARRVFRDGAELQLRGREMDILLYLAQHPDQVITKQELHEVVWKDNLGDGYYNNVAVQVKRLREKIERDPDNPRFIVTVWGSGYRFELHSSERKETDYEGGDFI